MLKLSNLQLGDYTFKLTVTDSVGKYSSSLVHVFVKSGNIQQLMCFCDKAKYMSWVMRKVDFA